MRDSASTFHWLSSSIFSFCRLVGRPASVTSPLISIIWCFRAYKLYIFCEDMILATCQCQHIFCCWVEPSLLLSSLRKYLVLSRFLFSILQIIILCFSFQYFYISIFYIFIFLVHLSNMILVYYMVLSGRESEDDQD